MGVAVYISSTTHGCKQHRIFNWMLLTKYKSIKSVGVALPKPAKSNQLHNLTYLQTDKWAWLQQTAIHIKLGITKK